MTAPALAHEDLFALPRQDGTYLLYAPLRRWVAVVNEAAVNAVASFLDGGEAALSPAAAAAVQALREQGLFTDTAPKPPTYPDDITFCPHEVTLFLTSRCNLRCRYCYADAGRKAVDMPWDVAEAAINLVARNAGLLGLKAFALGFHGGGEPTLAWDLLVRCVGYAREKAEAMGLGVETYAATNGLLSPPQRDFMAKHFASATVSLDGPQDIQDRQRPRAGGGGSFAEVRETLKHFDAAGFHYGIHATITAGAAGRMLEIVDYLHAEFHPAYLHMEPVWACGRCLTSGEKPPPEEEFLANYLRAGARCREYGIKLHYSGSRLDVLTSKFCAAPGDGFSVLPEGIATSCYEVTETADPRAKTFHYGRYDPASRAFAFDQDRLRALQNLSVEHLAFCRDCFCKWHCAGDCLSKVFAKSGSETHTGSTRCRLNRELTLAGLEDIVRAAQAADTAAPSCATAGLPSRDGEEKSTVGQADRGTKSDAAGATPPKR